MPVRLLVPLVTPGARYDAARAAAWDRWATAYESARDEAETTRAFAAYDAEIAVAIARYMDRLTRGAGW
jgi:hypothetical protein